MKQEYKIRFIPATSL